MTFFKSLCIKVGLLCLYILFAFPKNTLNSSYMNIYYRMQNEVPALYLNKNLISSFQFKNKHDCFAKCNQNSNCAIVYYQNNICMLYNSAQYLNLANLTSQNLILYNKFPQLVLVLLKTFFYIN